MNLRSLLLIGKKLPQLRLVLVVELLQVEVLDSSLGGVHLGQKRNFKSVRICYVRARLVVAWAKRVKGFVVNSVSRGYVFGGLAAKK